MSATKETGDYYLEKLGSTKIYKTGKAYVHEYIANTDLKLPDQKTMEKIELGLLNNKDVQTELIESLMKKGVSRETLQHKLGHTLLERRLPKKLLR